MIDKELRGSITKDPLYYGKDLKQPCKLILEIKCESGSEAQRFKSLLLEVLRKYGISRKVYKFYVEKIV